MNRKDREERKETKDRFLCALRDGYFLIHWQESSNRTNSGMIRDIRPSRFSAQINLCM
jgi:hypothetical protein